MVSLIWALALTLTHQSAPPEAAPPAATIEAVRSVLDNGLADYPSARFKDVRLVTRPSNTAVTLAACGRYNSRTPAGGYGGWTRFVVLNDRLTNADGDSMGRRTWEVWCDGADVETTSGDISALVSSPLSQTSR